MDRQQTIVERMQDFGSYTGIMVSDIISIKFRPTNQNLSDQDKSTFLHHGLYGEPPELSDIEDAFMNKIGPDTGAPMKAIKW